MRRLTVPSLRFFIAAIVAATAMALGSPMALSQGTPEATDAGHPAHIHSGTCESLGDVVFPLEDVSVPNVDVSPVGTPNVVSSPEIDNTPIADEALGDAPIIAESTSVVDASLEDILGAEHAVNVHESADNMGTFIACGDITGEPTDGMLEIEMQELNESGFSGGATLADNGDGTTTVIVTLTQEDVAGTPEATPAS